MAEKFELQTLLDLAKTRTDEAARQLGALIASERDSTEKLKLLENFLGEYHKRFQQAASSGIGPETWRNFTHFIARIEEAIATQRQIVEQSQQRTAQGQQAWIAQHKRLQAFSTLSQRHRVGLARKEEKQAQKLSDEFAARLAPRDDD